MWWLAGRCCPAWLLARGAYTAPPDEPSGWRLKTPELSQSGKVRKLAPPGRCPKPRNRPNDRGTAAAMLTFARLSGLPRKSRVAARTECWHPRFRASWAVRRRTCLSFRYGMAVVACSWLCRWRLPQRAAACLTQECLRAAVVLEMERSFEQWR